MTSAATLPIVTTELLFGRIARAETMAMYSRCHLLGVGGATDEVEGLPRNELARDAASVTAFCRYALALEEQARGLFRTTVHGDGGGRGGRGW